MSTARSIDCRKETITAWYVELNATLVRLGIIENGVIAHPELLLWCDEKGCQGADSNIRQYEGLAGSAEKGKK